MKEYYIDQNSIDKNYGLYDYLCLNNNTKTLGCISGDKYVFHIGIADHYCEHDSIEEIIGKYDVYFATHRDPYRVDINYLHSDNNHYPSMFQMEAIIGGIKECLKYQEEHDDVIIKVCVDGRFFENGIARETTNLNLLLDELNEMYDYYQL